MGADSVNEWITSYRSFSAEELTAERATIIRWLRNPYDSQTQGQKAYERQRGEFRSQLAALTRIQNERGNPGGNVGVLDASGGIWGADQSLYSANPGIGADGFPNTTS